MSKITLRSYINGFVLSIILTLTAYYLVNEHVNSGHTAYSHETLIPVLVSLALAQFIVQAIFFLHLKKDGDARWNLLAFLFMVMVAGTIVVGSLWIMASLDYHHQSHDTPQETNQKIIEDEKVHNYGH